MTEITPSIQIGEFILSPHPAGGLWLARLDGEGMQLLPGHGLDALEQALEAFWKEHF